MPGLNGPKQRLEIWRPLVVQRSGLAIRLCESLALARIAQDEGLVPGDGLFIPGAKPLRIALLSGRSSQEVLHLLQHGHQRSIFNRLMLPPSASSSCSAW